MPSCPLSPSPEQQQSSSGRRRRRQAREGRRRRPLPLTDQQQQQTAGRQAGPGTERQAACTLALRAAAAPATVLPRGRAVLPPKPFLCLPVGKASGLPAHGSCSCTSGVGSRWRHVRLAGGAGGGLRGHACVAVPLLLLHYLHPEARGGGLTGSEKSTCNNTPPPASTSATNRQRPRTPVHGSACPVCRPVCLSPLLACMHGCMCVPSLPPYLVVEHGGPPHAAVHHAGLQAARLLVSAPLLTPPPPHTQAASQRQPASTAP